MTPRIAIACSGLGHVQRGIESWAADLAHGLRRAGTDVTLFGAAGAEVDVLPTLRRTGSAAAAVARTLRHLGGWRFGLGSPYDVEQTSFAMGLWPRIRRNFDIVHVQDPLIAIWLEWAHHCGLSRPKVIYANGTGEGAAAMRRFRYLQLLTHETFDFWTPLKPHGQAVFMIPNLVDTARFHPGDQATDRAQFGLPPDRTIILCCAAIRRYHKRIDILLEAFAEICRNRDTNALLVIAGGREADTDDLIAGGTSLLGERVRFLPDLPRTAMPTLYRSADAFVLPSLSEMFGTVLLEALATGLPVLCNDTPDFHAIVGPAGVYRKINTPGELARGLCDLLDPAVRMALASSARPHVEALFSEAAVIGQILTMYQSVHADAPHVR